MLKGNGQNHDKIIKGKANAKAGSILQFSSNLRFKPILFSMLIIAFIISSLVLADIFYDSTQSCRLQNDGTWTACAGTYPAACGTAGDRLGCNDNIVEQSSTSKNGAATGLNMTDYNSSFDPSDCGYITSVIFCYEWWANGNTQNCQIEVSNESGANPTAVVSTCPGTTANPGVTCLNVTATKSWSCENFFGTTGPRATATATLTQKGPGARTISYDVFLFNVTYVRNYAPNVSLVSPPDAQVTNNQNISFICNATDDIALSNISLFTNLTGVWQRYSTLPVSGTYAESTFNISFSNSTNIIWNCYACDNKGKCSFAPSNRSITVDITKPTINQISDFRDPVVRGNIIIFTANITDNLAVGNASITINGINYSMIQNISSLDIWYYIYDTSSLSPGTYNYTIYANDSVGNNATPVTGNFTVIPFMAPTIYTDKTTYGTCSDIYFKVSAYDINDQPIDASLTNLLLDPKNTTVISENVNTGNGGTGIYLGVFSIPYGFSSGNWILRSISGYVKGQQTIQVS